MAKVISVEDFWELLSVAVGQEHPELREGRRHGTIPMAIPVKQGRILGLVVAEPGEMHDDVERISDRMERGPRS
jgi:hypothetical protein